MIPRQRGSRNVLLLSGLGPAWPAGNSFRESDVLSGTVFERNTVTPVYHPGLARDLNAADFRCRAGSDTIPLLRLRARSEPHLSSQTLTSILEAAGHDYEFFDLKHVWSGDHEPQCSSPDVVALSTTFICNRRALNAAIQWIRRRYPDANLVLGGQYSNLKYMRLMRDFPEIDYIIRGDAELAFPALLEALNGKRELAGVPNLVIGGPPGSTRPVYVSDISYIDLESHPSPAFRDRLPVIPYESMRGCPFSCKFCSFPSASPKWRYKSSGKICRDWTTYSQRNGAGLIKALDSTFTVPPSRFRDLLDQLPSVGVPWEAYTRANVIDRPDVVSRLEDTRCFALSIGFESMSDASLKRMQKLVSAAQNRRAAELLDRSTVDFRGSFIIGYPGETIEEYEETHRFLVEEYTHRFLVSVFSLLDETMPVWNDAPKYGLIVADLEDPDADWRHCGMDSATARELQRRTLFDVRWKNDYAVTVLWQIPFELPLVPGLSIRENYRVEKLLERIAFAPKDYASEPDRARSISISAVEELAHYGVTLF